MTLAPEAAWGCPGLGCEHKNKPSVQKYLWFPFVDWQRRMLRVGGAGFVKIRILDVG